jgi:hypothetical protein
MCSWKLDTMLECISKRCWVSVEKSIWSSRENWRTLDDQLARYLVPAAMSEVQDFRTMRNCDYERIINCRRVKRIFQSFEKRPFRTQHVLSSVRFRAKVQEKLSRCHSYSHEITSRFSGSWLDQYSRTRSRGACFFAKPERATSSSRLNGLTLIDCFRAKTRAHNFVF